MSDQSTAGIVLSDLDGNSWHGRADRSDTTFSATAVVTYPDGKQFRATYYENGSTSFEKWSTGYAGQGGYDWRPFRNPTASRVDGFIAAIKPRLEEARAIAVQKIADEKQRRIDRFHLDTEKQYAPSMHALLRRIYESGALKLLNDSALDDETENMLACVGAKAPGEDRG